MVPPLRELLLGSAHSRFERTLALLGAVGLAVATFVAYAVDLFAVSGGVLILPGDATLVGLAVATVVGYRSGGLVVAWLALFAPYLGFHADWAFLGLSERGVAEELAFFFDPVSLAVFGTAAVFFGTLAYGTGALIRRSLRILRRSALLGDS
ncbi:hypothetical protein [Salinigranum marinum]|uniref:hypothetical protein n=1 Tax=Salinigranum marinum TaxID=1515595 RepID=UPI002989EAEA|nr:hypothetical protein [Salinigranum marinum]